VSIHIDHPWSHAAGPRQCQAKEQPAREAKDRKTALDAIRAAVNIMAEARQYLELRGELTGELPHAADSAANVPLIVRVLTVPRLPGVPLREAPPDQTRVIDAPGEPATEKTEAARSLPAAVESSDIPPRDCR
jgi:hypothetical protein